MGENKSSSLKSSAFQRMTPNEAVKYLSSSPFSKPDGLSSSNLSVEVQSFTSSDDGQPLEIGPPFTSNRNPGNLSSEVNSDNVDSIMPMHRKTRSAIGQLQSKIIKTKEKIKKEQTAKEENVNEYLKLSNDADKQQLQRIKSVFEKKNLKSAQLIGQLQRKLEGYSKKAQQLSTPGSYQKVSKGVLKDVGQGLRDFFARDPARSRDASPSATGKHSNSRNAATLPGMAKSRDGSVLYKSKYGSADNITTNSLNLPSRDQALKEQEMGRSKDNKERSDEENDESSGLSDSVTSAEARRNLIKHPDAFEASPAHQQHFQHKFSQARLTDLQQQSSSHKSSLPQQQEFAGRQNIELERLEKSLAEFEESQVQVNNNIEDIKNKLEEEGSLFRQALEDERERCERMEDQINDLTELHQHEVYNIKQELMGIQEKMEYQLEERTRDIQELLLACQTKVTKMELQQQQQQIISVESIENSNLRGIITKLINVLLAILAVLLVVVSGVANFIGPFLQTRFRMVVSIVVALLVALLVNKWSIISSYFDTINSFIANPPDDF